MQAIFSADRTSWLKEQLRLTDFYLEELLVVYLDDRLA